MKKKPILILKSLIVAALSFAATNLSAQTLAFPTAEGYGKHVTGGRGGTIYEVTNLNASGTGSLGAAISASGPRIVVFRVSGTISGNFDIKNNDITIAGQTAPGDGICIRGRLGTSADNIIIRYIRVRWDPANGENDGMGGRFHKNIIFDHVSASWSTDEVLSLYHNENTTVQWCMIAEACPKGATDEHRFGGIWGNNYGTWHHNLIAHNASRNPRWASGAQYNDYRNNVLYNWDYQSSYGGGALQDGYTGYTFTTVNMVANYYKPGPATDAGVRDRIVEPSVDAHGGVGSWYVSGNYVEGSAAVTADNWQGVDGTNYKKLTSPWNAMPINQQTPQDAYVSVLNSVGASFPKRDRVDADIVADVRTGTAKYGNNGIIDSPADVGGYPTLTSAPAPADSDHDGMPDSWETANGLNPNNASDRNNIGPVGYTMVEIYLNGLVDGALPGQVAVTGVTVSPASATIATGATTQLNATVSPSNATNKTVTWSTSNSAIATVSSTGLVTGVAAGTATITATTQDGGYKSSSSITVTTSTSTTPTPLIKLGFNENTGTSPGNSGSVSATFSKTNPPTWSTNVPKNGGTSSVDFGTTAGNYYIESSSVINQLAGLSSFTITGWINCRNSTTGSGGNRVVSWINNGGNGVDVVYLADGSLKVGINQWPDNSAAKSNTGKIPVSSTAASSNWKFFAISYDSPTSKINFYFGDNSVQATLDKSITYAQGVVGSAIGKLAVGHLNGESSRTSRTDRMFKGLIDQVQVFNSALTLSSIQSVQNLNGTSALASASPRESKEISLIGLDSENAVLDSHKLNLYPNPVGDFLNISFVKEGSKSVNIDVFDMNGSRLLKAKTNNSSYVLDVSGLTAGIYVVKVSGSNKVITGRFLKK